MNRPNFGELAKNVSWVGLFINVIHLKNENDKGRHFAWTKKGTACSQALPQKNYTKSAFFAVPIVSFDILVQSCPKSKYHSSYREQ